LEKPQGSLEDRATSQKAALRGQMGGVRGNSRGKLSANKDDARKKQIMRTICCGESALTNL